MTVLSQLRETVPGESERDRTILLEWLGLKGALPTLEDIASGHGLTRERVRQLRNRSLDYSRSSSDWVKRVENELIAILLQRTRPLLVDLVDQGAPALKGLECQISFWVRFTKKISDKILLVDSDLGPALTQGSVEDLDDVRGLIVAEVSRHLGDPLPATSLAAIVAAACSSVGMPEFIEELARWTRRKLVFAPAALRVDSPSSQAVLLGVRGNASALCRQILSSSYAPLHVKEVQSLYQAATQQRVREAVVRTAVSEFGYPFGSSVYGLPKHLPISASDRDLIAGRSEEIVFEDDSAKQWHATEILEQLLEEDFLEAEELDHNTLSVVLHEAARLTYLGRSVWVAEGAKETRRSIAELVEALLHERGVPLTADEIRSELSVVRGLGDMLMLIPRNDVARLRPGVWGLLSRDFRLVEAGIEATVLEGLYEALHADGVAMHISEIPDRLGSLLPPDCDHQDLAWEVMAFARSDARFWLGRGQIIGLSDWSDLGRMTVREALVELTSQWQGPMRMDEITGRVAKTLGRDLRVGALHGLMPFCGITYDHDLGRWVLAEPDEEE